MNNWNTLKLLAQMTKVLLFVNLGRWSIQSGLNFKMATLSFFSLGFSFCLIELIKLSLRSCGLYLHFCFVEICKRKTVAFSSPKELVCHLNDVKRLICPLYIISVRRCLTKLKFMSSMF